MSDQPSEAGGPDGKVVLNGRFQIDPDKPQPDLDSPTAQAVTATDLRASAREMFVLVCSSDCPPRIDLIPTLLRLNRLPVATPADAGPVAWPNAHGGGRRFVIVFERNFGARVQPASGAEMHPMREDEVIYKVVKPVLPALKELSGRMLTHRAIRADNLFYSAATQDATVLGECVSAPPAMAQPVIYEPIDSAIARPGGRGHGTVADDLYAFGVMLVVLLAGGNPVAGMSDDDIIESKINHGSYATLVRDIRVSLTLMEPLRGLLCDDPKERWTVADLELWASGRQLSPMQPSLPEKAARAIGFAGKEYWNRRCLSFAMGRHWDEAANLVMSGELENWLRRACGDDEQAAAIAGIMSAGGGTAEARDRIVSRALIVLDPSLPVRFKTVAARIDALHQLFALGFDDPEIHRTFVGMMAAKVPQVYLQSQTVGRPEHAALMKTFDMVRFFMERGGLGNGLERALYQGIRGWPCRSPIVRDEYVSEIDDLLPALEKAAQSGSYGGELIDAHIVGFCAARMKSFPVRILKELCDPRNVPEYRLGILHVLSETVRASGDKRRYPALCRWLAGLMPAVIETYHNRAYRDRLASEIERAKDGGDIMELLFLVDSVEARNQDTKGFERARAEYADHETTLAWLKKGGLSSEHCVRRRSEQAATVISAVASGLAMVGLMVMYVN